MNIFILDYTVRDNARAHCDQHVVKMILESAQMLCTVAAANGVSDVPYKPTHVSHPCTLWVGKSLQNFQYLRDLAFYLNKEYRSRYGRDRDHKSWSIIDNLDQPDLPEKGLTAFARAMPEEFKNEIDPVKAYRSYYATKKFATWRQGPPDWWVAA